MSAASVIARGGGPPSQQPFQCMVCFSRFTRHENLKRHAALHSRSQEDSSLLCELCSATFSRPDLRHRHMRRKHPEHEERRRTKKAVRTSSTRGTTAGSDGSRSQEDRASPPRSISSTTSQRTSFSRHSGDEASEMDSRSVVWHSPSSYPYHAPNPMDQRLPDSYTDGSTLARSVSGGEPPQAQPTHMTGIEQIAPSTADLEYNLFGGPFFKSANPSDDQMLPMPILQSSAFDQNLGVFNFNLDSPERLVSNSLSTLPDASWFPSTIQVAHGCTLFFNHVSHFVPVLHKPTFDMTSASRPLVLAMLSLGYQYGQDPECAEDRESGARLSSRCFHRGRVLVASDDDDAPDDMEHNVVMVQTYLLLQICAMMYLCSNDSAYGLKMHATMIALSRTKRLMHPAPAEPNATRDLESLWHSFARAESQKRTAFTVHQIDALWYQLLSIPRSISHLEIKHGLPCPEDFWTASSPAEWAHRQLMTPNPGPPVQYADAVRRFLAPNADLESMPHFDSYGAINIAQFLISSAREISGWSTMTGLLSMDRFEILQASLDALRPFMRAAGPAAPPPPPPPAPASARAALCEATWETAMIELQMWSPSHTGGIVEGSMDAVLDQSAHLLAPSCEFLCESDTARAVQPHVDWFLRYLDATPPLPSGGGCSGGPGEAPWVTLYAYKAFLIAWQLVRGGAAGAMRVVGVADGDAEGALAWAREVFGRRDRWQLGKLTLRCLDGLQG
ncbi:hypothetical protein CONLIGDRAFT_582201 [Coniochaeta ligniaria NRRL 30616]|uniref:C2H2-type domain-containing protein n=1 Tax=Coniochaeta ligniaria NRRL 30616 TaxID=1408157 RepID=A0A1J7IXG6_9PEZI|nr:hypothetical protein CONLIGDRAFT_582201 [Coniochaeta ligniaria NRRL 30616]